MVAKGEEMVENGCPLKDFAQAFLKLDVVQVHGWANADGINSRFGETERRGGAQ